MNLANTIRNALRPAADMIDRDRKIRGRLAKQLVAWRYRDYRIETAEFGNLKISEAIASGAPFAVGRCGASELKVVKAFFDEEARGAPPLDAVGAEVFVNSGFFPIDRENLLRFGAFYAECARQLNIFAVWRQAGEIELLQHIGADWSACLCELRALEPYYFEHGWTDALAGRRVLIISPFAESIKRQHTKLRDVWPRLHIPNFELVTLRYPHSQALIDTGFSSWWALHDEYCARMGELDFDIAIIGAGASTLPLACHAKRLGRQGVALGGATQILFGIRGRRWDNFSFFQRAVNDAWTRPQGDEVPPRKHSVESGAYW